MEGITLEGRYRVEGVLGQGSTAAVYRAADSTTGRTVAIKVLHAEATGIPQARERFVAEGNLLAQIRSPHVVPVLDQGEVEGRPFLVMEFLEAEDLHEVLDRDGPMKPARARAVAIGIARGLQALHAAGIVHRDMKPANVLLDAQGEPRIADLGLAKGELESGVRTGTGIMMGTPGFLAPEVLRGGKAGPPADVYALGVILYMLHTCRIPFDGKDVGELMQGQLKGVTPRSLVALAPGTARLVEDLTHLDPKRRPDLDEVIRRLQDDPAKDPGTRPVAALGAAGLPAGGAARAGGRLGPRVAVATGIVGALAVAGWVGTRPAPAPTSTVPVRAEVRPEALFGDLGRVALRSTLEDFLGGDPATRLIALGKERKKAEENRDELRVFLEKQGWFAPLRELDEHLDPGWWSAAPGPGEDPEDHARIRRRAARRLAELQVLEIMADTFGPGARVLPDVARMLDPVLSIRRREDLPDRPDQVPDLRVVMTGCQIFNTAPEATGRIAHFMMGMVDPPSCPEGPRGDPAKQITLDLGGVAPPAGRDLRLVLGYFGVQSESYLEFTLVGDGGEELARFPLGFGRTMVFRRGNMLEGNMEILPAAAIELRIGSALHRGRARKLRVAFRNLATLLDGRDAGGIVVAGIAALP